MSGSLEPSTDGPLQHNIRHYFWDDYSVPPLQPSRGYSSQDLSPLQTCYSLGLSVGLNGQTGGSESSGSQSSGSQSAGSDYSFSQNVPASVLPPAPVSTQRQHSISDPPGPQFFPSHLASMPTYNQSFSTSYPPSPTNPNTYYMPETSQFPPSHDLSLSVQESSEILDSLFPQQEPPPVTSNDEFLVQILSSRPRPQCWDHGCNGREFSSMSNLLRHQREKAGAVTKAECPVCGAVFTRTTARNIHVFERCEGIGRSLQYRRRQLYGQPRELESDYLVSRGLEDSRSGPRIPQDPMLFALFNDGTGSHV